MSQPEFTITYCRNCDGGKQEFSTAHDAVKAVFPGAKIIEDRIDEYPVKVVINAKLNGTKMDVWSGRQQNLFRKYGDKRRSSIQEIQTNCENLKKEIDLND